MATNNHNQKAPKKNTRNKPETKSGNNPNKGQQEKSAAPDTDMEPDEFLAPNADTDLPIDHHVANDSVLRGEDHADEKVDNLPSEDK